MLMTCNHCKQELIEHYMFLDNEWIYCCTKCGVINANEETVETLLQIMKELRKHPSKVSDDFINDLWNIIKEIHKDG